MTHSLRAISILTFLGIIGFLLHPTVLVAAGWLELSDGGATGLYGVTALSDTSVIAVGSSGEVVYSTNGGDTWSSGASGTTEYLKDVEAYSSLSAIATGENGTIIKTTDGGATWSDVSSSETAEDLYGIDMFDSSTGLIAEGVGGVLLTDDGGRSWSWVEARSSVRLYDVHAISEAIFWAVGNSGSILVSADAGATWTNVGTSGDIYRSIMFIDEDEGWIGGHGSVPVLLHTTDGGVTWNDETPSGIDSSDHIKDVQFTDSDNGVLLTADGVIFSTSDGGANWEVVYTVSETLERVMAYDEDNQWAVGRSGGIYRVDGEGPEAPEDLTLESDEDDTSPAFSWSAAEDEWSDIDYYEVNFDGEGYSDVGNVTNYVKLSDVGAGSHSIYVRAIDEHGNVGEAASLTVSLGSEEETGDGSEEGAGSESSDPDTEAPTVGAISQTTALVDNEITLTATYSDNVAVTSCSLYVGGVLSGSMSLSSGVASGTYTFLSTGNKTAYVQCSDDAGNTTTGSSTTIVVSENPAVESADQDSLITLPCNGGEAADHFCKAVYYYGEDGDRHAFPNENVYFTWYDHYDDVITVTPEFMASISLGANVTYHPGTKMVTFQTTHDVYTVSRGGELRYVSSEDVAEDLYGTDWNTQIDDISDAFFGNYTFGDDINDATDYDVDEQRNSVSTVSDNF